MYTPHILIADSDANVRVTLTHLLEYGGYEVRATRPGREVVDCLANGRFKLLLLEIDIPAQSGLLLLGAIRRFSPTLPIIVLTSCSDMQTAVSARQFGVSSYLVKPINPANLLCQIDKALAGSALFHP
ncbi:MAG: response regulator [Chloroflexi bacterium]|nr:response regulator [Chloroflexota bacterium]MBP7041947.1 response regulator [Chloroflexota bacterium]